MAARTQRATGDVPYLTVAKIARPRGNRGEVAAMNLCGDLRCFSQGARLDVVLADRTRVELEVERAWEHNGRLILKFAGFDTISDAERLRLAKARLRKDAIEPPGEGEYLVDDLVGCRMVEESSGRDLGKVDAVYEPPGDVLLLSVLDSGRRELLVPFAEEICPEVDIEARRILVRLPEGMEALRG